MKRRAGEVAWAGLASYIIAYDLVAMSINVPTLSATFYRASTAKAGRWLLLLFWLYLTGHLFRWTPAKYDAFRMLDKTLPVKSATRR